MTHFPRSFFIPMIFYDFELDFSFPHRNLKQRPDLLLGFPQSFDECFLF